MDIFGEWRTRESDIFTTTVVIRDSIVEFRMECVPIISHEEWWWNKKKERSMQC